MPESATVVEPMDGAASARRRVSPSPSTGPSPGGSATVEKGWPLRLGVLTAQVDPAMVDDVVDAAGATQRRTRLLPARAVVYFVLALCLFSGADAAAPPGYRSVLRSLTNGLRQLPNAMVELLARRDSIAAAAQRNVLSRRSWAVVGNGANRVAANESTRPRRGSARREGEEGA